MCVQCTRWAVNKVWVTGALATALAPGSRPRSLALAFIPPMCAAAAVPNVDCAVQNVHCGSTLAYKQHRLVIAQDLAASLQVDLPMRRLLWGMACPLLLGVLQPAAATCLVVVVCGRGTYAVAATQTHQYAAQHVASLY
jgi:hypothetical protein